MEAPPGEEMARKRSSPSRRSSPVVVISQVATLLLVAMAAAGGGTSAALLSIDDQLDGDDFAQPKSAPLVGSPSAAGDRPKLIPLVAAESGYSENSSVNILCTVSQGHHDSLQFDWFKDGQLLGGGASGQSEWLDSLVAQASSGDPSGGQRVATSPTPQAPQLEKHSDHSLLRIARVQSQHAGRYTCSAKNQFGQDSSSVNLMVNVKLQWIKEPPKEIVVSLNQELKLDCQAQGEPKPSMRWEKLDAAVTTFGASSPSSSSADPKLSPSSNNKRLQQQPHHHHHTSAGQQFPSQSAYIDSQAKNQLASTNAYKQPAGHRLAHGQFGAPDQQAPRSAASQLVSSSRYLTIQRARESDSGFYECIASNAHDNDLSKLVHVQVKGPPKILPIATADSYPEGSSINLICTVSGGQRRGLTLSWTINGDPIDASKLRQYSADKYENILLDSTNSADISIIKIENATLKNSGQYTCTARNPLGEDSTSVDIVINVEMKWAKFPKDQVEVGLNQELKLECDATGSPQPTIEWHRHSGDESSKETNGTNLVAKGKLLKIARTQHRDTGLYECVARNGVNGENLRKVVHVRVRDEKVSKLRSQSPVELMQEKVVQSAPFMEPFL